jgi:nucleoside-diphosphate-sugar epimerase
VRALIAGGAGFIGSHLVDRLLADGAEVVVVDNFVTGMPRNLEHVRSPKLTIVRGEVASADDGEYDRVYHLASPASPDAYGRAAIDTLRTNSEGTLRLLRIAERANARFLLASTSEVYGDPLEHPQKETYNGNVDPIGPRSQYDEGKRYAEALTMAFVRERTVDARIVRIFNSYGPRMRADDGRMPSAFMMAALRGEPIPVHDDGTQTRSLCYVGDTVEGIVAAMERGKPGEVYNIGNPDEMTVREFAERVIAATGSASKIAFVTGRPQDIHRRKPDASKAARELGWRPRVSLEEGLVPTVAYYRSVLLDRTPAPAS